MIIFTILTLVSSKSIKTSIELTNKSPSQYLTKFGVDLGTGHWEIRLKLSKSAKTPKSNENFTIPLLLYRDSDWDASVFQCQSTEKAQSYPMTIPKDGSWSQTFKGSLGEPETPHIWFFMLADCTRQMGDLSRLRIELTIKSGDGSELPVEMKGMKRIYYLVCLLFTLLLGRNMFKLYKHFNEEEEIEAVLMMLNIAVVFEFISMVFYILHISAYEGNGRGVGAFEFFGSAGSFICDFIMISLLLLIAQGWSITFRDFPSPELYISVMIVLGFLNFVLAAIEMSLSDAYYLFSNYEGMLGWLIFVSRLFMVAWLYWNLSEIINNVPPNTNLFLRRFALASIFYILALPGLIVVAQILPPYKRHKFILGSNILVQAFAMFALSWLFTSKAQLYKISTVSGSILPGSKAHKY